MLMSFKLRAAIITHCFSLTPVRFTLVVIIKTVNWALDRKKLASNQRQLVSTTMVHQFVRSVVALHFLLYWTLTEICTLSVARNTDSWVRMIRLCGATAFYEFDCEICVILCVGHNEDGKFFVTNTKLAFDIRYTPKRVVSYIEKDKRGIASPVCDVEIVDFACGKNHTVNLKNESFRSIVCGNPMICLFRSQSIHKSVHSVSALVAMVDLVRILF